MGLLRFLARFLIALPYIRLGWDAAQEPGGRVKAAEKIGIPEPELAVRANGWTMVVAGSTLALGIFPRFSAFALISCLVPTTYAGHAFWDVEDPQQRQGQLIHFLKNVSMIGGLLAVLAAEKKAAEQS